MYGLQGRVHYVRNIIYAERIPVFDDELQSVLTAMLLQYCTVMYRTHKNYLRFALFPWGEKATEQSQTFFHTQTAGRYPILIYSERVAL